MSSRVASNTLSSTRSDIMDHHHQQHHHHLNQHYYQHHRYDEYSGSLDDSITAAQQQQRQYTEVELSIKCRNLKKMDWLSNTDAFCVVHVTEPSSASYGRSASRGRHVSRVPSGLSVELGRTEVVYDTQNPNFSTTFKTNFIFEEQQTVIVRVYDEDKKGVEDLRKQSFVGSVTFSLSELMGSRGNTLKLRLEKKGYVLVHGEEVVMCKDDLRLQLAGSKLKNRESVLFGKSDPFFTISRMHENGDFVQVYKSKHIRNNLFPEWHPFVLPLQKICNGDIDRPIQIRIFDYERDGKHRDMGRVDTTVRNMLQLDSFDVIYDHAPFGSLLVREAKIIKIPTFLDYLSGRCVVHFLTAIDFSSSNGTSSADRSCLHFIDHRGFPNEYQAAIATIGSILQDYAVGRKCRMFGFGMKDRVQGMPNHLFSVGNPGGVDGVDGMLEAYRAHIQNSDYVMSEPTLFAPLIKGATNFALQQAETDEQAYTILLLLTDGGINDMQQTIEEICVAADAPLSIVIVGIGGGNFKKMEKLDSDDTKLTTFSGMECWRDIVQFVPFRKYSSCVSRLAAETLAEIPDQLVQYFLSRGIMPAPKVAESISEYDIEYAPPGSVEVYVNLDDQGPADAAATTSRPSFSSSSSSQLGVGDGASQRLPPPPSSRSVAESEEPMAVATVVMAQPASASSVAESEELVTVATAVNAQPAMASSTSSSRSVAESEPMAVATRVTTQPPRALSQSVVESATVAVATPIAQPARELLSRPPAMLDGVTTSFAQLQGWKRR